MSGGPSQQVIVRGLESPEHLREWMQAAGREYLVLRVADVLEMSHDEQGLAIELVSMCSGQPVPDGPIRSAIQRAGVNGYLLIPRDALCSLNLDDLGVVQHLISCYRDVRLGKGEPSRSDPCGMCKGTGRVLAGAGLQCPDCDGTGEIVTFLEISEEEAEISAGKIPW